MVSSSCIFARCSCGAHVSTCRYIVRGMEYDVSVKYVQAAAHRESPTMPLIRQRTRSSKSLLGLRLLQRVEAVERSQAGS